MTQRSFPPPHRISKGYPFDDINSQRFVKLKSETIDQTSAPHLNLMHKEALDIAEAQLADIFEEQPFIPQQYGFEQADETRLDIPIIYKSKFNDKMFLHRTSGKNTWTFIYSTQDDKGRVLELDLPCARIAFAVFYALGIQMEAPELLEAPEIPVTEKANES